MNNKLLIIAIGPVQDFIIAARRTRDLWFGSHMLSELSKAAAKELHQMPEVTLIFPTSDIFTNDEQWSVANKIVAEIKGCPDIEIIIARVREAVERLWLEFAAETMSLAQSYINKDIWDKQLLDVIEFYAAWTTIKNDNYAEAREKAEFILAGRKALRDFRSAEGWDGVPKSSLDGARESVILTNIKEADRTMLRVKSGEHLDAVGLIKRISGGRKQYPSVDRIAVDPWVRGVLSMQDLPTEIFKICDNSEEVSKVDSRQYPQYRLFPFDGSVLFTSRLDILSRENTKNEADSKNELDELIKILKPLWSKYGEPSPYLAVLLADGDRIGAAISEMTTSNMHRQFSKQLSQFSVGVARIIKEQKGTLVYSGGDDVLAFLPIDMCLEAAMKIHELFDNLMCNFKVKSGDSENHPTLSVGIAIGHCLEPLEDLLKLARAAEKDAKPPERNGLAIHLQTRSGGEASIVKGLWNKDFYHQISLWIDYYQNDKLPEKLPYDLRLLGKIYKDWFEPPIELIQQDAIRLLSKKRTKHGKIEDVVIAKIVEVIKDVGSLEQLSEELVIASFIAKHKRQANPSVRNEREVIQ